METPPQSLYADFNNADEQGRVRLNTVGSLQDLARLGLQLKSGDPLLIHDEDLMATGVAEFSEVEKIWTVRIDWSQVSNWLGTVADGLASTN